MKTIKIGDTVNWRNKWGADAPKQVTIKTIDWVEGGKGKDGIPKEEVLIEAKDWCIFGFEENSHWAYGHQVDLIGENAPVIDLEKAKLTEDKSMLLSALQDAYMELKKMGANPTLLEYLNALIVASL